MSIFWKQLLTGVGIVFACAAAVCVFTDTGKPKPPVQSAPTQFSPEKSAEAGRPINVFEEFSAQGLAELYVKDPGFNLYGGYLGSDPAIIQKIADAKSILRQREFRPAKIALVVLALVVLVLWLCGVLWVATKLSIACWLVFTYGVWGFLIVVIYYVGRRMAAALEKTAERKV